MVNVSHDGHDGWTRAQIFGLVLFLGQQEVFLGEAHPFHFILELRGQKQRRVEVQGLVDGGHDAKAEQLFDQILGLDAHLMGQIRESDGVLDADFALGATASSGRLKVGMPTVTRGSKGLT